MAPDSEKQSALTPLGGLAIEEGADAGIVVAVGDRPVTVGRETSCDVRLTDTASSRRHFRVVPDVSGAMVLEDLESANGTFVNDARVARAELKPGDAIRVGETVIRFLSEAELIDALRRRTGRVVERDPVSGASTRRMFEMRLRTEAALGARGGAVLSVIAIEIDKLASIDARLGENARDRVLQAVALGLGGYLRENDMLARLGECSFATLVVDPSPNTAYLMAERMCAGIEGLRIDVDGNTVSITASIGVASDKARRELSPDAVIERACAEARTAAEAGGACVSRWVHSLAREPVPSVSGDLRGTVVGLTTPKR
ncbi:MAG: diguanylate cyclase [Myxococcota bacterium]|nr:diguanylate cyclase [Myxococcota bacterium]